MEDRVSRRLGRLQLKKVPNPKKSERQSSLKSQSGEAASLFMTPGSTGARSAVEHSFRSKMFLGSQECDFCHKLMVRGKKCSECKFKCHKKCMSHVPPSCGAPHGYKKFKMQVLQNEPHSGTHFAQSKQVLNTNRNSPLVGHSEHTMKQRTISSISSPPEASLDYEVTRARLSTSLSHSDLLNRIQQEDHSRLSPLTNRQNYQTSGSSSTPPSPISPISLSSSSANSPAPPLTAQAELGGMQQFDFPFTSGSTSVDDTALDRLQISCLFVQRPSLAALSKKRSFSGGQLDDDKTLGSMSAQQDCTPSTPETDTSVFQDDSMQLQDDFDEGEAFDEGCDGLPCEVTDSYGSQVSVESTLETFRISNSRHHRGSLLSEWEIPYDELQLRRLIAKGKMGDVYQAYWHGDVCVKMLYLASPTNEQLSQFKFEVSSRTE
jgi:kinase suppressor of Ras 2